MNEVMSAELAGAELESIERALEDLSVRQMMAICQTKDLVDATAMLATIYSTAKQSYRLHVTGLGYTSEDIDKAMQSLDTFFLMHPESL